MAQARQEASIAFKAMQLEIAKKQENTFKEKHIATKREIERQIVMMAKEAKRAAEELREAEIRAQAA